MVGYDSTKIYIQKLKEKKMIFLNIHIAISIICLILLTLSTIDTAYEFKRLYPDLKVPKTSWAGRILSVIKSIITALIPLFNIALCWVFIFKYSELRAKTIDKVYTECILKEKQKELKAND